MNSQNTPDNVLRVCRTHEQAKKSYDKMSKAYDYFAGIFEKKYRNIALEQLGINEGETVLEVGFGTGYCLEQIAWLTGKTGKAYGIDISSGMLAVAQKRLEKARLLERVELTCADATKMPYEDNKFDAVFMSFTLELFDNPEIPMVLEEIKRVLKPGGRLGVVSMSKENGESKLLKLYEWLHEKLPKYADCRPIYVKESLKDAGFEIKHREAVKLLRLPGEIVIGVKPS